MTRLLILSLVVFQILALTGTASADNYTFLSQWGDQRPPLWTQLSKPRGVAVDANSRVYVSAVMQNEVFLFDSGGNLLNLWSDCDGTILNYPMELTLDKNGFLYVSDTGNNRICVYYGDGTYHKKIEGGFKFPIGVAVDDALNVYVVDSKHNAVKKLDPSGSPVDTWSGFHNPWGILLHDGYVYVTDSSPDGMVWKFTPDGGPDGGLIKKWGPKGIGDGEFYMAEGITVYNNLLYVADGEYGRIHVFDLDGNWQRTVGERGTGNGQLQFSTALAVDAANGWLYVSDDDNDRVMRFDLNAPPNPPTYSTQWGCGSSGATGLRYPTKLAIDNAHRVMYVVDSANHRIRKMTLYPTVGEILSFGDYGNADGQFRFPVDAAVDSAGNVFVVDNLKRNVQKFSPGGTWLKTYDFNRPPLLTAPLKYLYGLHAIALDSADNMYVVDADTETVRMVDPAGNKLGDWPVNFYPTGISIDEDRGFIYVTSFFPDVVAQYDLSGAPTGKHIGQGNVDPFTNMFHPYSVAVDGGGNLLVADTFRNRLDKFGTAGPIGQFITTIGNLQNWTGDTAAGQFTFPYGVALDSSGYVYAADTNNHRIQVFRPDVFYFNATSQGHGAISCGTPTANYGSQRVCTITPDPGYYLSSLTDNGRPVAIALPGDVYTLVNVASDHRLNAGFRTIQTSPVRIVSGLSEISQDSIRQAYTGPMQDGDVIELRPITYDGDENTNFDRNITFTLRGGIDFALSQQLGYSIITTPVVVTRGALTVDHIIIR